MNQCEPEFCELIRDESGQAASEYALLAFWTVIIIVSTVAVLREALLNYYQDVASVICLPIP